MKTVGVIFLVIVIIVTGICDCVKYKRTNSALEETIKLINLFKNEINYHKTDYFQIVKICNKQGFRYIKISNNKLFLEEKYNFFFEKDFMEFLGRIGTTDVDGQIEICNEYSDKFCRLHNEGKEKEKSRIQINFALSMLGALSVIIVFL